MFVSPVSVPSASGSDPFNPLWLSDLVKHQSKSAVFTSCASTFQFVYISVMCPPAHVTRPHAQGSRRFALQELHCAPAVLSNNSPHALHSDGARVTDEPVHPAAWDTLRQMTATTRDIRGR